MQTSPAPFSPLTAPPARRLGRYEIFHRLGHGGMAEVFAGRHVDLGKRVAVKVMPPILGADDFTVTRLLREGRAATAIHHPNIVSVLDVGVEQGTPYLVMELLEGEDLAQLLVRQGPLPTETSVAHLLPVISGIAAVHDAGIVHRDLKPSNIFLARRHRGIEPVIVDFGISKFLRAATLSGGTGSQDAVGTARYMAPEQVRGSNEITAKTDQYALGVVLYECTTGGAPFWGKDPYELLHAIMTASIVPPSELNPEIPPALDAVVMRALSRDPADRFDDVREFGRALLPFASAEARLEHARELGKQNALDGFARNASDRRIPKHRALGVGKKRPIPLSRIAAVASAVAVVSIALLPMRPHHEQPITASPAASPFVAERAPAPPPSVRIAEVAQITPSPSSSSPAAIVVASPASLAFPRSSSSRSQAPVGSRKGARVVAAPNASVALAKPAAITKPAEPPSVLRGANDVPILEVE